MSLSFGRSVVVHLPTRRVESYFNGTPLIDTRHLLAPGTPAAFEDPNTLALPKDTTAWPAPVSLYRIPAPAPKPSHPSSSTHPAPPLALPHTLQCSRLTQGGHSKEGSVSRMSVETHVYGGVPGQSKQPLVG